MSRPIISIGARRLATLLPALQLAPGPLYLALADSITALVRDGRLAPDTRLPSERELATELQLSRATVTAAYDQLRERGLLASRTGAGSFVTIPATAVRRGRQISPIGWARPVLEAGESIDLTCAAMPAPDGVLERAFAAAAPRLTALASGAGYDPMGLPELRAAIAERFTARGVATSPDQILITSGALHAFDLLLRVLTGPGDRVLTELPSYPGALDAIRTNGARVVPTSLARSGGWDVAAMQAALAPDGAPAGLSDSRLSQPDRRLHRRAAAARRAAGRAQHRHHRHRRRVVRPPRPCPATVRAPPPGHRGPRFLGRHDRFAVEARVGWTAHRLGAGLGRPHPAAERAPGRQ